MKKILKVLAIVLGISLLGGLLWFANAMAGNPISRMIVSHQATQYLEETYPDTDYVLEGVDYSFKTGNYYARMVTPSSIDGDFSVSYGWNGTFWRDNYETYVVGKRNTYQRLGMELRAYGEDLYARALPQYETTNALFAFEDEEMGLDEASACLERDMALDIHNMPLPLRTSLTVVDLDASYKKVAEILMAMAEVCKEEEIPVVQYSVCIEHNGTKDDEHRWLAVYDIPAEILEEADLVAALEAFDATN